MNRASVLPVLLLSLASLARGTGQTAGQSTIDRSVVVTVISREAGAAPPQLSRGDIIVRENGQVRPVAGWQPFTGARAGVDLAVLIDDSLQANVALQWKAVGQFIQELPAGSRVAVAYGTQSDVQFAQPFTTDRALAVKALRIPLGRIDEGSSIYLSLIELLKRWPAGENRRAVLLVSNGIDLFYGIRESEPGLNMNLQRAIDLAQQKDTIVDTIFASGAGRFTRSLYLVNNGQSCLSRLTLETGGSSYLVGFETPLDFTPFLREILDRFPQQYRLVFRAELAPKAGFARLQLAAEQNDVELRAPSYVYLPAAK